MYEVNEYRHFNQRPNNGGKSLTGVDAEDRNGHRDGKLKIVRRSGKRECGGLTVVRSGFRAHVKRCKEHNDKIDQ